MDLSTLGILLGLGSAAAYGSGDFSGGLAARRLQPYQVMVLSSLVNCAVLLFAVVGVERTPISWAAAGWAATAGLLGTIGLTALYTGLARGHTALIAPGSGVLSAAIPVVITAAVGGLPAAPQLVGFALAGAGIWLASSTGPTGLDREGLWLTLIAGIGFGFYFLAIPQARENGVIFLPLLIGRLVMLSVTLTIVWRSGQKVPHPRQAPTAPLAGILDMLGSVLYLLSQQYLRVDVAAVLASLYPAFTLLLTAVILRESLSRRQWIGAATCIAAAALIAI
ncbi:MAG TPA: DMT family transporter [Anaerolineales bacterium]|nr:DMT family transporter [Anaerolineales bacterium]